MIIDENHHPENIFFAALEVTIVSEYLKKNKQLDYKKNNQKRNHC